MKKFGTILQSKYLFKIFTIVILLYSIALIIIFPFNSKYKKDETNIKGIVTKYQLDNDKLIISLKGKENIIVNYYLKENDDINIRLGQTINANGDLTIPSNNTIPNQFNYKEYLKYKKTFYILDANDISIIKENTSVFYEVKNLILKRIDKIDSTGYLRTFILGDKSKLNDDIVKIYQENGISHLFSISGMHVNFLTGLIFFFLNKVSYNNKYKYSIVSIFLIFYLFLTDISASILRTTIMFLVFSINKCFNLKIKSLDLMLLVLSIALLINPFLLCDVGFQFSYLISFSLIVKVKDLKKINNKLVSDLYLSFICFLISIPICINNFGKINILSIIFNLFMIPLVSNIIFPISFITLSFPKLYFIYDKIIFILEKVNILLSKIDLFKIIFIKPNTLIFIIYLSIIFLYLFNKKFIIVLIMVLFIHKLYPYLDSNVTITYLDVGQGDSIFLKFSHNKGNILIDTGGIVSYNNTSKNVVLNKTIPYLYSLGIEKLDYLILTHGDYDHMGDAIMLVENFNVEKVIFNCGEFNDLEHNLVKILNKKKISYYSCIKELNIDNNKLYFLQTKKYDNENDNSNVIYAKINGYKFIFMGDAGVDKEKDILNKYNILDIDVLKVGHHGSNTSSNKAFIDEISPKYSIISVGKNNSYKHPNSDVLKILKNTKTKIYRTDQDGSIMFRIKNNKFEITTYSP